MNELSLNAGNELDDEQKLTVTGVFDDPQYGDVPDLEADLKIVTSLETQLMDLRDLADSIEAAGGMSQEFALEGERIWPGLHNGTNINFYSKAPSATRLKVSLEELSKGMIAVIVAAVAAAIGVLIKLTGWFGNKTAAEKAGEGGGGAAAKHDAAKESISKTADELDNIRREKVVEGKTVEDIAKQLAKSKDSKVYEFLANDTNAGIYDILSKGKFYRDLHEMVRNLDRAAAQVGTKWNLLAKMIHRDATSDSMLVEKLNDNDSRLVDTPTGIVVNGHSRPVTDLVNDLRSKWNDLVNQTPKVNEDLFKVINGIRDAINDKELDERIQETELRMEEMSEAQSLMEKMQKDLSNPENDGHAGMPSTEYGPEVRRMISSVLSEQVAVVRLYGLIIDIDKALQSAAGRAEIVAESLFSELEKLAKDAGEELSESILSSKKRVKEERLSLRRRLGFGGKR